MLSGSVEKKEILPRYLLQQEIQMLVSAWDALSTQTVLYYFQKSGISTESQETAIAEDDDPFRQLQDEIDNLRSIQPNLIEEDFDATTFTDVDVEVIALQPPPSDAEIVAGLLEIDGDSDDDDDDDDDFSGQVADESVKCPDKNEAYLLSICIR